MTKGEYCELRAAVEQAGFGDELRWAEEVRMPSSPEALFFEYGWVVCCSGMREQVARGVWERVKAALSEGLGVASVFNHEGKASAIQSFWDERDRRFTDFQVAWGSGEVLEWCEAQEWIGPVTKWHLAKNVGLDVAKPDRWLERVAARAGESVSCLCSRLAIETGDRVATVDLVIWRACNLGLVEV